MGIELKLRAQRDYVLYKVELDNCGIKVCPFFLGVLISGFPE